MLVKLDRQSKVDLSQQIYEQIRELILSGKLTAGQRIPSSRELSEDLKISRPTVAAGFAQLENEGFLELRQGSGTYVSSAIKSGSTRAKPAITIEKSFSDYGRFIQERVDKSKNGSGVGISQMPEGEPEIAFYCWRPALDQFPLADWARTLGRHARDHNPELLDAPVDPSGERTLREAIAGLVGRFRGVNCDPDQVILVSGLHQGIDLVGRLHLTAGGGAVIEDPGYHMARFAFTALGGKVIPVPVDDEGLQVERLPRASSASVDVLYLTPSHQFPCGMTMSLSRRMDLLDWARKAGAVILEDDYDSEYQTEGKPIPALMSLDKHDNVIYAGTLNQLMFRSLGMAYLIVPSQLVATYRFARELIGGQPPPHLQTAAAEFISSGRLDRHIKNLRALYSERRDVLVESLRESFADRVTITGITTGVFVLARFETKLRNAEVCRKALDAGVGLTDTSPFYADAPQHGEYILGFGSLTPKQIKDGVKRLAKIIV